jgi:hypothetical protein
MIERSCLGSLASLASSPGQVMGLVIVSYDHFGITFRLTTPVGKAAPFVLVMKL